MYDFHNVREAESGMNNFDGFNEMVKQSWEEQFGQWENCADFPPDEEAMVHREEIQESSEDTDNN